jgi:YbbR domain-containing protein
MRAYVDLSKATTTTDQYPVIVDLPDPKAHLVEVVPPRISVRLDENIDRQVPVRVSKVGSVPFGYEAGDADVESTTVTLSGPGSVVRTVEAARVEIRLDGVTSSIDSQYTPIPVDAQGQPVTSDSPPLKMTPATIRIRVPINQQLSYKTVGIQPNIVGSVQSGFVIEGVTTEPSAVTILGTPQALASTNFAQTEQVDVSDANATFARQVSIIVPEGVSVVQDVNVRVTVRIAPISLSQSVSAVPIPENLTPGLQVVSALPSVQIVVQGSPSALRGDIHTSINLAGLGPGAHLVAVDVTVPPGVTVQSTNPGAITVTLAEVAAPTSTPAPTPEPPTETPTPRPTPTLRPTPTPTVSTE